MQYDLAGIDGLLDAWIIPVNKEFIAFIAPVNTGHVYTSIYHVHFAVYVIFMPSHLQSGLIYFWLASFPGSCAEEEKKEPGTHC